MASITLYNERGKLVFIDTGHIHKPFKADEIHVHEIDLSKITLGDLEKLERDSKRGCIELHTWKNVPGAMTTRKPTSDEARMIDRYVK